MLSDMPFYSAHFMNLATWEEPVRRLCAQHGFGCKGIQPGLPGTFPTFIVRMEADRAQPGSRCMVVKFFGSLFEGSTSFAIERAMSHYLAQQSLPVRSPVILAEGQLSTGWQYLIFEGISGVSIGQVRQQLSEECWVKVAGQMGIFMKGLHTVTATTQPVIPIIAEGMSWDGFVAFLEMQRANCHANHQRWKDLPEQLLGQVQGYLLPVEELLDFASPSHLIHADLTGDHLLGQLTPIKSTTVISHPSPQPAKADWDNLAIIDWGDTRAGNILYELVALHLDLFQANKHLLSSCLEHYCLPDFYQQDFPRKALCMTLLHQFPMATRVYEPYRDVQTLNELAAGLFEV
jgi:hypothetical protein